MLEILAHSDLSHKLVLVPVHPRQLTNVSKRILQPISQLEGIHISKTILYMRVNS